MTTMTEKRMDEIMGRLLRTGVILAAAFVLAGGLAFLVRHPEPVTNYRVFQGEPEELRTVPGIFHEALGLHGRGLIQLGLLILMFLYQRDWMYVAVTLTVLGLLVYSLLGGGGSG